MSTSTFTAAPSLASGTTFNAWGGSLSTALAAVGLTKTTDTGQVTWSNSVTPPGALNTYPYYEIWKFADALQSTSPIFMKIEYGSSFLALGDPGMRITVGTGSDGAGNLTGNISSSMTPGSGGNSATTQQCYVSSDGGRLNVVMFAGTVTNVAFAFYIERLKNNSGAAVAGGVDMFAAGYEANGAATAACFQQWLCDVNVGLKFPFTPQTVPLAPLPSSGTGTYGSNVGLYPILPIQGFAGFPTMGALVFWTADISTSGVSETLTMYGTSHTFITVTNFPSLPTIGGNTNAWGLAMRYE
jgi:hypothetical protein